MERRVIVDSCVDTNDEIKELFDTVPLSILIDDEEIIDDNLDQGFLIKKLADAKDSIKTACPSPEKYLEKMKKYKESFVVTLSAKLSGSYNSAVLASNLLLEKGTDTFTHVFNTKSASAGETLVALKIKELMDNSLGREEIIKITNDYIEKMQTLFVLDSYEVLKKTGRLSNIKAGLLNILNIAPIMGSTEEGSIRVVKKVRGKKKALKKLVDVIGDFDVDYPNTVLGISRCNAEDKAFMLKEDIEKKYNFKDIKIFETRGISTVYASDGGIVLSF
jgi:DegV family protein with EDD domain